MESVTVIRKDMSDTAEIAVRPCWKEGQLTLLYTIIVFTYRIYSAYMQ